MRRFSVFVCVLLLAAVFLLQNAADARGFPVTVTYRYPAISELIVSSPEQAPEDPGAEPLPVFPLKLNAATREELMAVPRIGEILSGRIVQYRDVLGGYTQLSQLTRIKGISENTLREISPYLIIE